MPINLCRRFLMCLVRSFDALCIRYHDEERSVEDTIHDSPIVV